MDMTLPKVNAPTLQSSAMLLRLNISMYTGRKADKKTKEEVVSDKGAGSRAAASVYKSLFAGDADLEAINTFQAKARKRVADITLPWSDGGDRLVSTRNYFEVARELSSMRGEFDALVTKFVNGYTTKVSNAAFALGDLFDRTEYPDPLEIKHKFDFRYSFEPVPSAGDFRVDLQNDALNQLRQQYQQEAQNRLDAAVGDVWSRVLAEVTRLRDKMIVPEDGKRPRIFESSFDGFKQLVESLEALNITNDPSLEDVRVKLKGTLDNVDIGSLRDSDEVRESVKAQMQSVLDKFTI